MVTTRRGAETGPIPEPSPIASSSRTRPRPRQAMTPPWLPTPLERVLLGIFPATLLLGTLLSVYLAPDPSIRPYFGQKTNIINVVFVKRGWGWMSLALAAFALTHPSLRTTRAQTQVAIRWAVATTWWFVVTQWFFGAPIIDRGFRWTGGKCDLAELAIATNTGDAEDVITAAACRAAGGSWRGGHDISGHVFLLVLASAVMMMEVGWVVPFVREERFVVTTEGDVKSARVPGAAGKEDEVVVGGAGWAAVTVIGLSIWMLLMTAIYFHTWFEKLTGLVTAAVAVYTIYYIPRVVPAAGGLLGLPGV